MGFNSGLKGLTRRTVGKDGNMQSNALSESRDNWIEKYCDVTFNWDE